MTSLDNTERKFYQDVISSLLQYNGMLITALTSRGQVPPPPPMMMMPSFGIEMNNLDDMKKLQSAWKDFPLNLNPNSNLKDIMKIMGMIPKDKDNKEDDDDDDEDILK